MWFHAKDFGIKNTPFVKAHYASIEDALRQAKHNVDSDKQVPIRITEGTEDNGAELWKLEDGFSD
jgi:hypothetical protein